MCISSSVLGGFIEHVYSFGMYYGLNKEINAFNAFISIVRVKWDKSYKTFCLL